MQGNPLIWDFAAAKVRGIRRTAVERRRVQVNFTSTVLWSHLLKAPRVWSVQYLITVTDILIPGCVAVIFSQSDGWSLLAARRYQIAPVLVCLCTLYAVWLSGLTVMCCGVELGQEGNREGRPNNKGGYLLLLYCLP